MTLVLLKGQCTHPCLGSFWIPCHVTQLTRLVVKSSLTLDSRVKHPFVIPSSVRRYGCRFADKWAGSITGCTSTSWSARTGSTTWATRSTSSSAGEKWVITWTMEIHKMVSICSLSNDIYFACMKCFDFVFMMSENWGKDGFSKIASFSGPFFDATSFYFGVRPTTRPGLPQTRILIY